MSDYTPIARSSGTIPCLIPSDMPHVAHGGCPGRASQLPNDILWDEATAAAVDWLHLARQYGLSVAAQYYPTPPSVSLTGGTT